MGDHSMQRVALVVLAFAAIAHPLAAQKTKEPKRPNLAAAADTNDAQAYYNFALERMRDDAGKAADALYLATRINPLWAAAYYARRIALLLDDPSRLGGYWSGDERTMRSKEIKAIDSLYFHALTINPFLSTRMDGMLLDALIDEFVKRASRGGADAVAIRFSVDTYLARAGPATRGARAYSEGRFEEALAEYAKAEKDAKRKSGIRIERAHICFQLANVDSALVELTAALEEIRKSE